MSENAIMLSIAIFPVLVLAFFIYKKDKFEKEPILMLLKAFFFGCLSIVPAFIMETFLSNAYGAVSEGLPSYVDGLYTGYVVAGFSEELCKLLLLWLAVWRSRHFNEYFDGIVYAAFVSLGFAGIENIGYVLNQPTYALAIGTGTGRAILSVPAHFLFGVVMGYYFALAKFQPERRVSNIIKAFFYPMLIHGTFDALLMIPAGYNEIWLTGALFIVFIYFDVRLWVIGMRRLKNLQSLSQQQYEEAAAEEFYANMDSSSSDDETNSDNAGGNPFSGFDWNV